MADFVGCVVSVHCGDVLGTYQGLVSGLDQTKQTLTIVKAFRNGIQCNVPSITVSATDITDLKIIKTQKEAALMPEVRLAYKKEADKKPNSTVIQPPKPKNNTSAGTAKKAKTPTESLTSGVHRLDVTENGSTKKGRSSSANALDHRTRSASPGGHGRSSQSGGEAGHKGVAHSDELATRLSQNTQPSPVHHNRGSTRSPQKSSQSRGRNAAVQQKNQDCFGASIDSIIDLEFDFEKNLALFDKQAVFDEIELTQFGTKAVKPVTKAGQPGKYKCDENVLPTKPVAMRQIVVAESDAQVEYVTDSGLCVPSVTYDLRDRLLSAAVRCGLDVGRQMEACGRSSAEMIMQLLGGGQRLSPQNTHQQPLVVFLCGPNFQGAMAANCARHLTMHGVKVTVFLACPSALVTQPLSTELELLSSASPQQAASIPELPRSGVDMIVCGVEHPGSDDDGLAHGIVSGLVDWVTSIRAPLLALDPPVHRPPMLPAKWTIGLGLPLSGPHLRHSHLYLCDVGIPQSVFTEIGINYTSPFAHKFLIPLHPKV